MVADRSERLYSTRLEQAMRRAAEWHEGQTRRGSKTPYFEHLAAVGMILDRSGFDEATVIAGLLHDAIEDTEATFEAIVEEFGQSVAETVAHCSEVKLDAEGRKRPWIDRKRDHLSEMASAPLLARAVILADKLHNLTCIALDLKEGRPVWDRFHAGRSDVLWYYGAVVDVCSEADHPGIHRLANACRRVLEEVGR